ncbi:MAG: 30S ribosomal protein S16, partial [Gemmatimonadetes bacterium]|nr:30S ribosomal protein S16 [Gemmatimonadota bacterium]
MSVRIRLRRMGRKKQAHYRIVVADSAAPRDGRFVETLGYYKPLTVPARLVVDLEKADEWIAKGAEQSETMRTLLNKARKGGDDKVAIGEIDPEEAKAAKAVAIEERRKGEAKAREEALAAAAAQEAAATAAAEVEAEEAAASEAAAEEPAAEEEAEPEAEAAAEEPAAEEEAEPEAEAAAEEPAA